MTDFVAELQALADDAAELAGRNRRLPAAHRDSWGAELLERSLDLRRLTLLGKWQASDGNCR